MRPIDVIRDALARIVFVREELDPAVREQALSDLEGDLASWLAAADSQFTRRAEIERRAA